MEHNRYYDNPEEIHRNINFYEFAFDVNKNSQETRSQGR